MHVLKLEGENFMRLKTVDVDFNDGVVEIQGKNRQGKSSLLKMIEALGGKKSLPNTPLKEGEVKGKFCVYMGEDEPQFMAKWTFNDKGNSYLTLESADKGKCGSPADVLKDLISPMLDPWKFYNLGIGSTAERKKAVEIIKDLMHCDYDVKSLVQSMGLDEDEQVKTLMTIHKEEPLEFLGAFEGLLMEVRKEWNSKVKDLEGTVDTMKKEVPLDKRNAEVVTVSSLLDEQRALQDIKAQHDQFSLTCDSLENEVQAAEMRLKEAKEKLEARRKEAASLPEFNTARLEELSTEIADIEILNDVARKAQALREKEEDLEGKRARAKEFDDDVESVRAAKVKALNEAEMPVDCMTIEGGSIMLNGIPFDQASSAEALSASIDVAVALKPKLKTLVCHNASLLDEESKTVLTKKAEEHGFQMLLEVVKDESEPGIIFVEDGVAKNAEN